MIASLTYTARSLRPVTRGLSALLLTLCAFLYLSIGYNRSPLPYDEGLMLYGAQQILNEQVIYQDFWTLYGPGQYYLLVAVFKLFGVSIAAERVLTSLTKLALTILVYLVAKRLLSRGAAMAAAGLSMIWLGPLHVPGTPMPATVCLALSGSLALMRYVSGGSRCWLFAAGVLGGLITLFRHDVGFLVNFANGLVLVTWALVTGGNYGDVPRRERAIFSAQTLALYLMGTAVILGPVTAILFAFVPCNYLAENLVVFPLTVYSKVRSIPYPSPLAHVSAGLSGSLPWAAVVNAMLKAFLFYFPVVMMALSLLQLLSRIMRDGTALRSPGTWNFILLLAISGALYLQAFARSDLGHVWPSIISSTILFCLLGSSIQRSRSFRRGAWALLLLVGVVVYSRPVAASWNLLMNCWVRPAASMFSLENAKGIYNNLGEPYEAAVKYIIANVPPSEKIYVGQPHHGCADGGDLMFYFLAGRSSATRYHVLHAGLTTTAAIQDQIIRDLHAHRVRYIVLTDGHSGTDTLCPSGSGARFLDHFIQRKFEQVQRFGDYTIWEKK